MKIVNSKPKQYCVCPICKEFIGPYTPIISMSYGFLENDGIYSEETVIIHSECSDSSVLGILLEQVETG
jgi:hypothetical protein